MATEIGERIREARKALGWSQEVLAERVGVDQGQVSRWERGESTPTGRSVARLSRALEVPADLLMTDSETDERLGGFLERYKAEVADDESRWLMRVPVPDGADDDTFLGLLVHFRAAKKNRDYERARQKTEEIWSRKEEGD